jgi:hypothetical protein
MARSSKIANGKTVHAFGGLPDARMGKADKIHNGKGSGGKNSKAITKVHNTIGGVVHAVSHNYGHHGAKGRELHGGGLGTEDEN